MSLPINEISGGGKAAQFEEIGDRCRGVITLVERRQQRDFSTGEPLTWSDGSPRQLTYIELQTDERADNDDDGVRALYLKGGRFEVKEGSGESGEQALLSAAKAAGASSIEEGASLDVVLSGRSKPTTRGYQPAKLFTMKYEQPVSKVDTADLFGD